jgi:hypothetical protein
MSSNLRIGIALVIKLARSFPGEGKANEDITAKIFYLVIFKTMIFIPIKCISV